MTRRADSADCFQWPRNVRPSRPAVARSCGDERGGRPARWLPPSRAANTRQLSSGLTSAIAKGRELHRGKIDITLRSCEGKPAQAPRHHGDLQAATSQPFFAFYPGETENRQGAFNPPQYAKALISLTRIDTEMSFGGTKKKVGESCGYYEALPQNFPRRSFVFGALACGWGCERNRTVEGIRRIPAKWDDAIQRAAFLTRHRPKSCTAYPVRRA